MTKLNDFPQGGTGLLAVFCDLEEADQVDFRPWLIENMFPARLDIGFENCASFDRVSGDGSAFATLYDMPSIGHLYDTPYLGLRRERDQRDADNHDKFQNPDRCTLTWAGPELSGGADGFASYIYVDRFDLAEAELEKFNTWYVGRYLPALLEIENLVRVRRYLSMEGTYRHLILHELEEPGVMEDSIWQGMQREMVKSVSALYERVVKAP